MNLLANPLVVSDRIDALRNEQRLQEFLKRMVEPVEGIKVLAPPPQELDPLKVEPAGIGSHPEAFFPQALAVVGQPLHPKTGERTAAFPDRH